MKENQDFTQTRIEEINKIQQKSEQKTIFISEYVEKKERQGFFSDFYLICIENALIIIEETEIQQFYTFFSQNKNSLIYTLDDNIKAKINESLNLQLNFSNDYETIFLKEEIYSFSNVFKPRKNRNDSNQYLAFLNMIFYTISGYLIAKSHTKSMKSDKVSDFFTNIKLNIKNEDEYIELRCISQNSILLVYHIESERLLILKLFFDDYGDSDHLYEREVKNYSNLQYPFFPRFYGSVEYYSFENIVIEYISGKTLDELDMTILDKEKKIKMMFQIMLAIEYLHQRGLIYRDLKPNNIITNENGSITIIDFDRMIDENTIYPYTMNFNHSFIAPEINEGKKPTKKADIYSIGKMIEYMFSEDFPSLKELSYKCTLDELKRPDISEVIDIFYHDYFSKISAIDETDTMKRFSHIHTFSFFWFYISENKHPVAQYYIGMFHNLGFFIKRDRNKIIQYFKQSADQDNVDAIFHLGLIYFTDNEVFDINKSIYYFTLASNKNYREAQNNLGLIYYEHKYLHHDIKKSIYYFTLAADQNYLDSQFNLGVLYSNGKEIPPDLTKALYYLSLAANQNHKEALFLLGNIFFEGNLIQRDVNKSISYFMLAANQNLLKAQFKLGEIYEKGEFILCDINKSIHYYQLASDQNHSESQYRLGEIFLKSKNVNKAIHYFTLSSNNNHLKAQFELGMLYFLGENVTKDVKKAIYYFTLSADQNYVYSQSMLGLIYLTGIICPRNIFKAIHYLKLASNQNDSDSQHKLGWIYFRGEFVPKDMNQAIHFLTLSADQNNANAQYDLGVIYFEGDEFIPRNIKKSIHYFTLAAKNNVSNAQYNLGLIYLNDKYHVKDIQKSIQYLTLAANQNNQLAQILLGRIYFEGKILKKDEKKSIFYFDLAARQDNPIAQLHLGSIYTFFLKPKDINKGLHYYNLAANKGNADALFNLGFIYDYTNFVPKDMDKSILYYSLAANQNHPLALLKMGIYYLFGKYVKQDINKAIHYMTLSANQNCSKAQLILGIIYEEGEKIQRDIKKSIYYYSLSANLNNCIAQEKLGKIYLNGKLIPQDIKKAIYYLTYSANNNNSQAQFELGKLYYDKKYIKRDIDKSFYYLKLASNNLYVDANFYLGCIYLKGDENIAKDVDKSIHYFKKASSFNDKYSKNNLGIIYKNIKKNEIAVEYFNEAINQKDDGVAMYNLGKMLFYGQICDIDIDKSINLLIKSSNKGFQPSKDLLCVVLIKKIKEITIKNISKETKKHGNENMELNRNIYQLILKFDLKTKVKYDCLYSILKDRDFIYIISKDIVDYSYFMKDDSHNVMENIEEKHQKMSISESFYNGFGKDIL